jgi:putative endonuclease
MTRDRHPFVYILASKWRGTIYVGVTSDLPARIWKHREGVTGGFASKYRVWRLVHLEPFADMTSAIAREKQLKNWHRPWKINLIERDNRTGVIWRWGWGLRRWRRRILRSERVEGWTLKQVQGDGLVIVAAFGLAFVPPLRARLERG